jgi:uncharacterized protein (DUF4213/DUF364 family)
LLRKKFFLILRWEMPILDDLISALQMDTSARDIRQGLFHTGVLTRYCGLAATLPRDALRQKPPMVREPGTLLEKSPLDLARLAYSDRIPEAAIGMATINSLLEVDEHACLELNAADLIREKGEGKRIVIIGHFPFVPQIRDISKELRVIEKNPREDDCDESEADNLVPRADVVAITGTTLTNHSLEHLLALCNPKAFVILVGDTAPLSAVLFDHGIDAISGTKVLYHVLALRCVSQGANYRQIKGIKRLTLLK